MDYEELQFAATIRQIAGQLKQHASSEHFHDWASQERESLAQKRAVWDLENPAINFVPQALEQLQKYAVAIKAAS